MQTGVYFDEKALGAAEENHVVECNCGIEMTASACPTLERNVVTGCTEVGVYVSSGNPAAPKMLIRGNQITGNAVGVQIEQCGNPILEKNTVEQNTEAGVRITANGAGEVRQPFGGPVSGTPPPALLWLRYAHASPRREGVRSRAGAGDVCPRYSRRMRKGVAS